MEQLRDDQLANIGYARDAQNPNKIVAAQGEAGKTPAVTLKDGKVVIQQEVIDGLQQQFPETAAFLNAAQEKDAPASGAGNGGTTAKNAAETAASEGAAPLDYSNISRETNKDTARRTRERAAGTLLEGPGYRDLSRSPRAEKNMSKSEYKQWEMDQAGRDAQRGKLDRGELFNDVADIWKHSTPRIKELIEAETMKYKEGSSKESFRTTISKKILEANRLDRTFLDGFDWHGFGVLHNGEAPPGMFRPHNHHSTVQQKGWPQDDLLVRKGQDILWDEGIDPLFGGEHLGWAPFKVPGQHTTAELKANIAKLEKLQKTGANYNEIAKATKKILKADARRPPTEKQLRIYLKELADKAAKDAETTAKKIAKDNEKAAKGAKKSASSESPSSGSSSSNSVSTKSSFLKPPPPKS